MMKSSEHMLFGSIEQGDALRSLRVLPGNGLLLSLLLI